MSPTNFADLIDSITPEMHGNLQRTVQLGRYPDGRRLTREEQADLLHTLLVWESKNLPEHQRSGYLNQKNCSSTDEPANTQPGGLGHYQPNSNQ